MLNKKTAVILFNLGGPTNSEEVRPFLFNLFNDKAIIGLPQPLRFLLAKLISGRREKKAQKIYSLIGGKSPLLDLTMLQADSLEKELSFFGEFKVFVVMRYNKPFAVDVVKNVLDYNPKETILLPLYPQFSTTTTESSIKDWTSKFFKECQKRQQEIKMKVICCYPNDADFVKSHSLLIKQTLMQNDNPEIAKIRLLFSAHGLPQKVINAGDPYVFQVELTSQEVVKNLAQVLAVDQEKIDFEVCYQSKVGPLEWTKPSLETSLKKAILDDKIPVIIPIAFVSEHSETLVELDIEYKEMAQHMGAKSYIRVPALNSDGNFVKSLTEICKTVARDQVNSCFTGKQKDRICPKKWQKCPNFNFCS